MIFPAPKSWFPLVLLIAFGPLGLSPSPALAGPDFCRELKQTLPGTVFQTVEPLYDTEIGPDGIWRLERDEEEIDPQRPAEVMRVKCRQARVALRLRPFDWDGNPDTKARMVDVYFYLDRFARRQPDGFDTFEIMLGYVFAPAEESE